MISLKTSLKKLYNKVTGKKTNKESISEIIDEMQDNYNGASAEYVDEKIREAIASVYTFKGSVDSYSLLPSTGQKIGDVYNVLDSGINYAWDGEVWDDLGGYVLANGSGTPVADLTKLQVGSIIYSVVSKEYVDEVVPKETETLNITYLDGTTATLKVYIDED